MKTTPVSVRPKQSRGRKKRGWGRGGGGRETRLGGRIREGRAGGKGEERVRDRQ